MRALRGLESCVDVVINEVLISLAIASVNLNLGGRPSGGSLFDFVGGTDLKIGHYMCTGRGKPLPYIGNREGIGYKGIAYEGIARRWIGVAVECFGLRSSTLMRECVGWFGSAWEWSSGRVVLLLDRHGTDDFFP